MRLLAAPLGLLAVAIAVVVAALPATSQDEALSDYIAGDRRSGFTFLTPETRALQNDDFANPGLLWVEQGEAIWTRRDGEAEASCDSCHGDASTAMKGVAAHYPKFALTAGRVVNLEQQINLCRTLRQKAEPYAYESAELLAIRAFIGYQSRGLPVDVAVDGPAAGSFERGRTQFYTRIGQLDLSCADCHENRVGAHLRGDTISQGQINGFPIYRQMWQTLGSTHRMFAWCNEAVRAEPLAPGSQDYVDLELYEAWRGRGLPVETPAIRR